MQAAYGCMAKAYDCTQYAYNSACMQVRERESLWTVAHRRHRDVPGGWKRSHVKEVDTTQVPKNAMEEFSAEP
jgi:hypothetical protein